MMNRDFGVNQGLVEEMFLRYCANPSSVSEEWRTFFSSLPPEEQPELTSAGSLAAVAATSTNYGGNGVDPGLMPTSSGSIQIPGTPGAADPYAAVQHLNGTNGVSTTALLPPTAELVPFLEGAGRPSFAPSSETLHAVELQGRVSALVNAFRVRGHLFANLDPLGLTARPPEELMLERYGLDRVDSETVFSTGDLAGPATATLREIVDRLRETYCRSIGVEFTYIEDRGMRTWLQERMESTRNRLDMGEVEQIHLLTKLIDAEHLEQFLHTNYVGAKRFSLEGAESVIPLLDLLVDRSADLGVEEIVIGMAHRGRLNVLANIMGKRLHEIFAGFEDADPDRFIGRGDVKYHLGYSSDRTTLAGNNVHLTLTFNPSHLEFVDPVVEGRARAKQERRDDSYRKKVLPLLIHGDAAFAGQGIIAETLNLAQLEGYDTGGTVHVVINNQIGFTTLPSDSRSTRYCTDITRMLRCPVFHVNGEDPEAVAQVVRLATEFRQQFHQDVVIDLYCYRKYGHNEADEPRFTQPVMYGAVDHKETVRQMYYKRLVEQGRITAKKADEIQHTRHAALEQALQETRQGAYEESVHAMQGLWHGYTGGKDLDTEDVVTGLPLARLEDLIQRSHAIPQGFSPHPKIRRLYQGRVKLALEGAPFDWGTAENLSFASLVDDGVNIRISGQDARRGTFSHRHAVVFDVKNGQSYAPLQHMREGQGVFNVYDSPLSEAGVLGFEFGYSLDSPDALTIWEAQFGDFANGAQVLIDQFIVSSEDKWHRLSGLVMLLPHGFEGQGPEHSSARLERFLAQCAEDNIQVCNLTTAAQIFHVLRRQMIRPWRKPLVIMSPKSLLRHPMARSTMADLAEGTTFQRIIPDAEVDPKKTKRVLLCSGKVAYDLISARTERALDNVAIVRVEQLYPLQQRDLDAVLGPYADGTDLVWVQEEPWNMGARAFIEGRVPRMVKGRFELRTVSRPESASPATGSHASHQLEQRMLIDQALEGL